MQTRNKQAKYIAMKLLEDSHPGANFYGNQRKNTSDYIKNMVAAVAKLEEAGIIHFPVDDRFY
jgi:hypothetical protein